MNEPATSHNRPGWSIFSGVCATMTGVGLARFAYAPLLPAIVQAGLLTGGQAGALGAINLGGYLCGAAAAPAIGRALGVPWALRGAMLTATAMFLLCALPGWPAWLSSYLPGGLAWLSPWRGLTGAAGGVLMVLAGPAVQAVVPATMRGLAAGLVFAGVGSGIVLGALLIPLMLPHGLPAAWLALAAVAVGLTLLSFRHWPNVPAPPAIRLPPLVGDTGRLVASYACAATAQTVHMVWWPDFLARGLGHSTAGAAQFWMLWGASAALGPALCGRLADRIGAAPALRLVMALQVIALALPLLSAATTALIASAMLSGSSAIGSTALTLVRARALGANQPDGAAAGIWRISTMAFGLAQTLAGFGLAWLYTASGGHTALFTAGLAAAVAALVLAQK